VTPEYPTTLHGEIRDLRFKKPYADGWVAREIIVKQVSGFGYPDVGDFIVLVGPDGWQSPEVTITKGAKRNGWALIGRTGQLRPWFKKHYPEDTVQEDTVILTLIKESNPPHYKILTSLEQLGK